MKQYTIIVLLLLSSINTVQAQLPLDRITEIVKTEVDHKRSKGMVVATISEKGIQVFGYGIVTDDSNRKPDGNTIYEIGSITKVFTSIILADMVNKGEVKLSDPISKYLPKTVKVPTRKGKEITLVDLATHTSGLPRMPSNFEPKDRSNPYVDYTVDNLYEYIAKTEFNNDIGAKYDYSNIGVAILGHVLALRAGTDYETLVRERVLKPLKMDRTAITLTPIMNALLATGHNERGKTVPNWDLPTFAGAGALRSSVNDLLLFLAANIGLTETELSPALTLSHQKREHTDYANLDIGLGWHVWKKFGTEVTWHNGGTGGYCTFLGFDKTRKTGVVVLSSSAIGVDDIALNILNSDFKLNPYQYKWALTDAMNRALLDKGIDTAIQLYHDLKKKQTPGYSFDEQQINTFGYELLEANKVKDAIEIFKLNVETYPDSSNVYDSLGEAYAANGDIKLAIRNYEKSVAMNPDNTGGIAALKKLKGK